MEPVEKTYIVNVMSIQANILVLTASQYLSLITQTESNVGGTSTRSVSTF